MKDLAAKLNQAVGARWEQKERRSPKRREAEARHNAAKARLKILLEPGREFYLLLDWQVNEWRATLRGFRRAVQLQMGADWKRIQEWEAEQ